MEDPLITMRISSAPATANMSHQSLLNKHVIIFSNFRLLRNYFFLLTSIPATTTSNAIKRKQISDGNFVTLFAVDLD